MTILGLWAVSAAANFDAGQQLSHDDMTSFTLGLASIGIDCLKAVSLFIVAAALVNRRWLVATVALIVFTLCASWSLRSATQFILATLVNNAEKQHLAGEIQQSKVDLLKIKMQRAGFLSQQKVDVTGPKTLKLQAMTANKDSSQEFQGLVADIESRQKALETAPPPEKVDVIAETFGVDQTWVWKLTALGFALLLEIASGFGFWLIAMSRTPKAPKVRPEPRTEEKTLELTAGHPARLSAQDAPPPPAPNNEVAKPVLPGDNVFPIRKVLGPMTPVLVPTPETIEKIKLLVEEPIGGGEAIDPGLVAQIEEARTIITQIFEASAGDRVLYGSFGTMVNDRLPKARKVPTHLYAKILVPAVSQAIPGAYKERAGGNIYIYGIKPRLALQAANG